jgi:hypothetical protein
MERNGMCDSRDAAFHKEEKSGVKTAKVREAQGRRRDEESDLAGEECWLQFVAFDVRPRRAIDLPSFSNWL